MTYQASLLSIPRCDEHAPTERQEKFLSSCSQERDRFLQVEYEALCRTIPKKTLKGVVMTRTIVITGADSGIGKNTAALAKARGWQVIRADLRRGDVQVDLATQQGRSTFVQGVTALVGDRLDAVIACAGVASPAPLTLQVNYFGAIATLQGMRPLLAKGTSPRAIGISSFASVMQPDSELVQACLS